MPPRMRGRVQPAKLRHFWRICKKTCHLPRPTSPEPQLEGKIAFFALEILISRPPYALRVDTGIWLPRHSGLQRADV